MEIKIVQIGKLKLIKEENHLQKLLQNSHNNYNGCNVAKEYHVNKKAKLWLHIATKT